MTQPLKTVPAARRFLADRRGNVAMMFGLLLLPILGSLGLAIDFGTVMAARTKGQMAADAAALQAAGVARELVRDSDGGNSATTAALAEGKKRGDALFAAHAVQAGLTDYTIDTVLVRTGQVIKASANFSVKTATRFGALFKQPSFTATGSAVATGSLPNYSDVYLALDISGSMGIAATQDEMVKLFNAKGKRSDGSKATTGCVFGCHVIENGWSESFSTIAAKAGIRLRIDVLRDAVQSMITAASEDAESAPIYRLALYTLGASSDASTWSLNEVYPLSNNFSALHNAADSIDIATPPASAPQKQNSYINEQLNWASAFLPISYDGASQSRSRKYVFLITDGARDVPSSFGSCITPSGSGRCVNGINPAVCKAMKDKNITVGVLYTTYVPVRENPANPTGPLEYWFKKELVDTGAYDKIQPALQACASDGWFYQASDDVGIAAAMEKMFAQTTQIPSLTN